MLSRRTPMLRILVRRALPVFVLLLVSAGTLSVPAHATSSGAPANQHQPQAAPPTTTPHPSAHADKTLTTANTGQAAPAQSHSDTRVPSALHPVSIDCAMDGAANGKQELTT